MAHWLTVQVARLLTQQGAPTCIMTGTIVGAAIGAAALSATSTAPVHSAPTPSAIATPAPPAAPSPCVRLVRFDGQQWCGSWFHHRGHHFGPFGHGRHDGAGGDGDDWGSGFWPGRAQPTPLVPSSPNGGMINAPVNSGEGFGM